MMTTYIIGGWNDQILSGLFSLNLDFNLVEHESKLIFCVTYFVYFI